jgi:hypothetical protein
MIAHETAIGNLGYTVDQIAKEGREVYFKVLERNPGDWDSLSNEAKAGWMTAAVAMADTVSAETSRPWHDLAKDVCESVFEKGRWPKSPPLIRYTFQAVARHMCNLMLAEDGDDLKEINAFDWQNWVVIKLGEKQ